MLKPDLPHLYRGKVRDLYEVDEDRLLIVASDRISVFDIVLDDEIPDKGRVLTGISSFWFDRTASLIPNHVISCDPSDFPDAAGPEVAGRAMLVHRSRPVRLECIARGYLFGGAWSEYQERGTVQGRAMPPGMQQAERKFTVPKANVNKNKEKRKRKEARKQRKKNKKH